MKDKRTRCSRGMDIGQNGENDIHIEKTVQVVESNVMTRDEEKVTVLEVTNMTVENDVEKDVTEDSNNTEPGKMKKERVE